MYVVCTNTNILTLLLQYDVMHASSFELYISLGLSNYTVVELCMYVSCNTS